MEDRLQEELMKLYGGKKVQEEYADCGEIDEEELLSADGTLGDCEIEDEDDDYYETEITETMGISVEIDEDGMISEIWISFHTSSWGDSGLGEEDPEDYFTYEECLEAAKEFIEDMLAGNEM